MKQKEKWESVTLESEVGVGKCWLPALHSFLPLTLKCWKPVFFLLNLRYEYPIKAMTPITRHMPKKIPVPVVAWRGTWKHGKRVSYVVVTFQHPAHAASP